MSSLELPEQTEYVPSFSRTGSTRRLTRGSSKDKREGSSYDSGFGLNLPQTSNNFNNSGLIAPPSLLPIDSTTLGFEDVIKRQQNVTGKPSNSFENFPPRTPAQQAISKKDKYEFQADDDLDALLEPPSKTKKTQKSVSDSNSHTTSQIPPKPPSITTESAMNKGMSDKQEKSTNSIMGPSQVSENIDLTANKTFLSLISQQQQHNMEAIAQMRQALAATYEAQLALKEAEIQKTKELWKMEVEAIKRIFGISGQNSQTGGKNTKQQDQSNSGDNHLIKGMLTETVTSLNHQAKLINQIYVRLKTGQTDNGRSEAGRGDSQAPYIVQQQEILHKRHSLLVEEQQQLHVLRKQQIQRLTTMEKHIEKRQNQLEKIHRERMHTIQISQKDREVQLHRERLSLRQKQTENEIESQRLQRTHKEIKKQQQQLESDRASFYEEKQNFSKRAAERDFELREREMTVDQRQKQIQARERDLQGIAKNLERDRMINGTTVGARQTFTNQFSVTSNNQMTKGIGEMRDQFLKSLPNFSK